VLGRALQDAAILPKRIMLYRELIRALFLPA
jgi:hypothetical protein